MKYVTKYSLVFLFSISLYATSFKVFTDFELPNASDSIRFSSQISLYYDQIDQCLKVSNSSTCLGTNSSGTPVGVVMAWFSNTPLTDWLLCNGQSFSSTTYSELSSVLGVDSVPDLRGVFLRGLGGIDPDAGSRTIGSKQFDESKSHNHSMTSAGSHSHSISIDNSGSHTHSINYGDGTSVFVSNNETASIKNGENNFVKDDDGDMWMMNLSGLHNHTATIGSDGSHSHTINNTGGSETRPVNISVHYIIKAR